MEYWLAISSRTQIANNVITIEAMILEIRVVKYCAG
jgi:hypothetical protein